MKLPNSIISVVFINLIILSLVISGVSSLLASINYVVLCLSFVSTEAIFVFSIFLTAVLLEVVLPLLTGLVLLLASDLYFGTRFFIFGDP